MHRRLTSEIKPLFHFPIKAAQPHHFEGKLHCNDAESRLGAGAGAATAARFSLFNTET
jgi:hypothetical protein